MFLFLNTQKISKEKTLILLVSFLTFISWNYLGLLFPICIYLFLIFYDEIKIKSLIKQIIYVYIFWIAVNIGSIFWLYSIPFHRFVSIILFSSFLMLISSSILLFTKSKVGFLLCWVFFEYLFTKWDLAWPWLTLGNVMGNQWYLVQWYSVFGVYGGSIWIICIGMSIYSISKNKNKIINIALLSLLFLLPIYSLISIFFTETTNSIKYKAVCFTPLYEYSNYERTKSLAKYVNSSPELFDFVITPELFYNDISLSDLDKPAFESFYKIIFEKNIDTKIFIGSDIKNNDNLFNGTLFINHNSFFFKSKKKYVPITEYTPTLLSPIFGSSFYTKNISDDTDCIYTESNIIPILCYEILFSDFVAKKVKYNSFILLSTSENFIKNSFGNEQYLNIVRLRAIENSKYLIKCSNGGISCLISPRGFVINELDSEFNTISIPERLNESFYSKFINSL